MAYYRTRPTSSGRADRLVAVSFLAYRGRFTGHFPIKATLAAILFCAWQSLNFFLDIFYFFFGGGVGGGGVNKSRFK